MKETPFPPLALPPCSAAKVLRKSLGGAGMAGTQAPPAAGQHAGLAPDELRQMYERVIKLVAENKITKNNAWDLDIIYHMPNMIR
jgi:hypothetical protein